MLFIIEALTHRISQIPLLDRRVLIGIVVFRDFNVGLTPLARLARLHWLEYMTAFPLFFERAILLDLYIIVFLLLLVTLLTRRLHHVCRVLHDATATNLLRGVPHIFHLSGGGALGVVQSFAKARLVRLIHFLLRGR